ncbi:SUMF1/EgtB/PvdO family nonheme iron enzyme [Polyangium jinanense]|uniref:SUMF1/EgtB/PvdO family nonheme iron enzyme n=1 Tax=Polyangium jinanense TaxID=2829994 RepID=UPI002340595F|nr:SUMF1/EgtB/PvdO family nonheme iron enzyme [Polyangium jinanense]MDC3957276.1 SUMF1/EgtB/PvdO family nonheme iron enzyme [Polyangium jinanense]
MGQGAYAQVVQAEEVIVSEDRSVRSDVVAKIFLDVTPEDANIAFEREVELLDHLRGRRNIVSMRGVERRRPPTFVCGECGDVFVVERCPECEAPLFNEGEISEGMRNRVILHCGGDNHTFQKTDESFGRLLGRRPCKHRGPCDTVNFLFRPCIYLELLHVNLREYGDLLARRRPGYRGRDIFTLAHPERQRDEWLRETFLMRLTCLVKIAEALEQIHRLGHVHSDIAPENVMVSLSSRLDEEAAQVQVPTVIDFGQARRVMLPRETVVIHGRHHFVAPEVTGVNNAIESSARILASGSLVEGQECEIACRTELAEGDYVWDGQGGAYEVLGYADDQQPPGGGTAQREEAVERRYRLRVLGTSKSPQGTRALWANQAVRPPADLFSFGCVAAWLLTDGNELVVQQLRNAAQFAASENRSMEDALSNLRNGKTYMGVLGKMPLPSTPQDDEIRYLVIDVILRCLMRVEGAYATARSTGYERGAAKAARDLANAHDQLYFLHRTKSQFLEFLQKDHRVELEGIRDAFNVARREADDVAKETNALRERCHELERTCASLNAELSQLSSASGVQEEKDALQARLDDTIAHCETLMGRSRRLQEEKDELQAEHARLEATLRTIREKAAAGSSESARAAAELSNEREKRESAEAALKDTFTQLQAMQESSKELRGLAEQARQKLLDTHGRMAELEDELQRLKDEQSTLETSSTSKAEVIKELQRLAEQHERTSKRWRGASIAAGALTALVLVVSLTVTARGNTPSQVAPEQQPTAPLQATMAPPEPLAPSPQPTVPKTQRSVCERGVLIEVEVPAEGSGAFCIDPTEVTAKGYKECISQKQCTHRGYPGMGECEVRAECPINCVNGQQAQSYCAWKGGRLPTEDEWRRALRVAMGAGYAWDGTLPAKGALCIGKGLPCCDGERKDDVSKNGLSDMFGNVSEWVLRGDKKGTIGLNFSSVLGQNFNAYEGTIRAGAREVWEQGFRCVYDAKLIEDEPGSGSKPETTPAASAVNGSEPALVPPPVDKPAPPPPASKP